jgi:hypothetical protein
MYLHNGVLAYKVYDDPNHAKRTGDQTDQEKSEVVHAHVNSSNYSVIIHA